MPPHLTPRRIYARSGADDIKKQLDRLEGMKGSKMAKEQKTWMFQRLDILTQVRAHDRHLHLLDDSFHSVTTSIIHTIRTYNEFTAGAAVAVADAVAIALPSVPFSCALTRPLARLC